MSDGLFGGLSQMLFGSAPGASFDPSVYLTQMSNIDSQIQGLYDNAPKSNILGSPAFAQIQSLLAPGANGGLSTPLQGQYSAGALINALNASRAGAQAQSSAQARNLSGSSIEAQGMENASMQETLANSGLLASLYGLQNQNTGQLAGLLGQGSEFDVSQNNALLNAHAMALGNIAGGDRSMAQMGFQQNQNANLAQYQNAGNLGNSLLSALTMGFMMPGGGGAAGGAGGAGMPFAGGDAGMGWGGSAGYGSGMYA